MGRRDGQTVFQKKLVVGVYQENWGLRKNQQIKNNVEAKWTTKKTSFLTMQLQCWAKYLDRSRKLWYLLLAASTKFLFPEGRLSTKIFIHPDLIFSKNFVIKVLICSTNIKFFCYISSSDLLVVNQSRTNNLPKYDHDCC